MTEPYSHERSFPELELVALGAAAPEVTAGVLAHAGECGECRGELDRLTLLLAALTVLIPERTLNRGRSAGIRSRLMARADADLEAAAKRKVDAAARKKEVASVATMGALPGWEKMVRAPERPTGEQAMRPTPRAVTQPSLPTLSSARGSGLLWAIIATVALLGVAAAALVMRDSEEPEPEAVISTQVVELEARVDSLERALAASRRNNDHLTGASVQVVDLVSYASGGRPLARLFWNTASNRWLLYAYELRAPRADHIYQVWAQTAQGRISAGTFFSADDSTGRLDTTIVLRPASVRSIFITEEPEPGSGQPTGRPLAAGAP